LKRKEKGADILNRPAMRMNTSKCLNGVPTSRNSATGGLDITRLHVLGVSKKKTISKEMSSAKGLKKKGKNCKNALDRKTLNVKFQSDLLEKHSAGKYLRSGELGERSI